MNVTVALLSALVVLPPMLVWADRRNLVSRGLLRKKQRAVRRRAAGALPRAGSRARVGFLNRVGRRVASAASAARVRRYASPRGERR